MQHATASTPLQLTPALGGRLGGLIRVPRGLPRFHADLSDRRDSILGCPQLAVPADDAARIIRKFIDTKDFSALERGHSALGRKPVHPRFKLGAWLYGSVVGVHEASKLAKMTKDSLAMRLCCGGHGMGASTLKNFRLENVELLTECMEWTVAQGVRCNLVDPQALAADSMRVRADASSKSIRTLERSKKRLAELEKIDPTTLDAAARGEHAAKLDKHTTAVARCEDEGRTSHSVTDPGAALIKFPYGASAPGHRLTTMAAGVEARLIVWLMVDSSANDFGHLEQACEGSRAALIKAGMPVREGAPPMQVAADPGYLSDPDLRFADAHRGRIDVLIHQPDAPVRKNNNGDALFGREAFKIGADDTAVCPAGKLMHGPMKLDADRRQWRGIGCAECPLKAQCTKGKYRTLTQNVEHDRLHAAMARRMAEPGAQERYGRRMCTVEPPYSYIEDVMGFRRSTSRDPRTVRVEILMKVVAYNLLRLAKCSSLRVLRVQVDVCETPGRVLAWT
jgi:hypothetical protein